jgi:translation initiation factor 1A
MGKRKVLSESHLSEFVKPQEGELLGKVIKLAGGENIIVKCIDDRIRVCRISGKLRRKTWIRENDVVLVRPWDFKPDRADIIWRYIPGHIERLEQEGYISKTWSQYIQ